jgi:nucleoid DNA-binding protein
MVWAYTYGMTKSDFIGNLAENLACSKQEGERVLDAMVETLRMALANGERIDLRGLGSFKVRESKTRQGRNPKTGATIMIPAKRTAAFRPGKELTVLLNAPSDSVELPSERHSEEVLT